MAGKTQSTTLAKRYTDALFTLAVEKGVLSKIEAELTDLATSLTASPEFRQLSESPLYSNEQLVSSIGALVKKLQLSEITGNLLKVLAENRRLPLLATIASQFALKAQASRGELTAVVTSQRALSGKEKEALAEKLGKKLSAKIAIEEKIDASILGGLIIHVGSHMMDASVQGQLERLSLHLKQNISLEHNAA